MKRPDHADIRGAASYRVLALIALPNVLSSIIEPLAELVDTAFVGRLGLVELAGLSACNGIFAVSIWIFNFLTQVSSIELSHARGSDNAAAGESAIKISLGAALLAGLTLVLVLMALEGVLLTRLMGLSGEHLSAAQEYYNWRLISLPFALISASGLGILRGLGLVHRALSMVLLCTLLNTACTALFLYSFNWGLAGVAAGTFVAYATTTIVMVTHLIRKHMTHRLTGWLRSWRGQVFSSFSSKSVNQFGRTLALSATFLGSTAIVNQTGSVAAAAYQVSLQLWLLGAYILDGLAMTAVVCGGYAYGAQREKDWASVSKKLTVMAFSFGAAMSLIYLLFPQAPAAFTNEPTVLAAVGAVWWVIILMQVPNALSFIADGLLFSRGEIAFVRKRMVEGVVFIFLPLVTRAVWPAHSGSDAETKALLWVWIGSSGLNLYRLLSGYIKIRTFLWPSAQR